jgi:hypothetical protein
VTATISTLLRRLRRAEPWFIARPLLTLLTAAGLLAVAVVMLFAGPELADAGPLLLTLPIALLATTFGLRGGVLGSATAVIVLVATDMLERIRLSPLGWTSQVLPLLLLGLLLGDAMERLRRAEADRIRWQESQRRHREAVQLNDTIVQSLSAAKWALEAADLNSGLEIVSETLEHSNQLVSDLIRGAALRPLWMGETTPR